MINNIDAYKHGSFYEIFIHRAVKSSDTSKPGTHGSIIQNLIRVENGDNSFIDWHGSYKKQLENVKKYMHKAMDKYFKMKSITPENLKRLELLNSKIDTAKSSIELMDIIYESNELTESINGY